VQVKDRAGFIVNALLFPYLNNAVRMLENGTASRDDIDTAMKGGCNFPMGPFALLDLVGLDTSLSILDALYDEFRDPNYAAVPDAAPHGRRRPARPQGSVHCPEGRFILRSGVART
jgi:3-hydroxybutyryl-CoA dehydrogenase